MLCVVLLCRSNHQVGQDGQRHVLKRNSSPMEQFQIKMIPCLNQWCDFLCVKFLVIGLPDTLFQFFFCKICQEQLHNLVCRFLIGHARKLFYRHVQGRQFFRHKQPAVICKAF